MTRTSARRELSAWRRTKIDLTELIVGLKLNEKSNKKERVSDGRVLFRQTRLRFTSHREASRGSSWHPPHVGWRPYRLHRACKHFASQPYEAHH